MASDSDSISNIDDLDEKGTKYQIHNNLLSNNVLSEANLKRFRAEQDQTGVVYLSRIPPFMKPNKLRSLLSTYGEIGRIYLRPEGRMHNVSPWLDKESRLSKQAISVFFLLIRYQI